MPLAIRTIRLARWDEDAILRASWLGEGEMVADPLGDLCTKNGELSVWHVEDDRSNLERVLLAFAATRDYLANVDYVLFDQDVLRQLGVEAMHSRGGTPDELVNSEWHRDIVELSCRRVVTLAESLIRSGQRDRMPRKRVRALLTEAIEQGRLELGRLSEKMKAEVSKITGSE